MKKWTVAAVALTYVCIGTAQDQGGWRPQSNTASAITGDVALGGEKLAIGLAVFPMAHLRALTPAEIHAVFSEESGAVCRRQSLQGAYSRG